MIRVPRGPSGAGSGFGAPPALAARGGMKRHLEALIRQALLDAAEGGALKVTSLPPLFLEVPNDPRHGDLACPVALALGRTLRQPPRAIAETILAHLRDPEGWLESREVAGPGFMNFRFSARFWQRALAEAMAAGERYGLADLGQGRRVQVEFVSANPTGPLHIGHGRGAVIGDVIARLLEATGHRVEREYYVNDAGHQMELLGESAYARYCQLAGEDVPLPPDGYPGEYLVAVARALRDQEGERLAALPRAERVARCREFAAAYLLDEIRAELERFAIHFDEFVSERALGSSGAVEAAIGELRERGLVYAQDGALFFRSSAFGDEKDRAVLRRSGEPTYFGADVAHYREKLARGHDLLVNVLGADHHGYVPRLRAAVAALGHDPSRLRVVLVQLVHLTRRGSRVRMGKREGEFVTLREVLDEVGPDAARFFFLLRKADSQLEFDLELAARRSSENPVFYVQYGHARIASLLRQAAEAGCDPARGDPARLGEVETKCLREVASYPDVIEGAVRELEPHRVAFHLLRLAGAFHRYYNRQRIIGEDRAISEARLALALAVQRVLRGGLGLLGISAPERM